MARSPQEIIADIEAAGIPHTTVVAELQKRGVDTSALESAGPPARSPIETFSRNGIADATSNIRANAELGAYAFPPLAGMKVAEGTNIYDPQRLAAMGKGMWEGVKDLPGQMAQEVAHPIDSFYRRPFTTAMDIGSAADLGANVARPLVRSAAEKFLPAVAKSMAGIPEQATEMAVKNPTILDKAAVPEGALNEKVGRPIIDAFAKAKQQLGERYGKIFKDVAGMEGPMQEIIDTPIAQKITPIETKVPVAQKIVPTEIQRPQIMGGGSDTKMMPGEMINESQVTGFRPGEVYAMPRKSPSMNDITINKNFASEAFSKGDPEALKFLYKKYVSPNADLATVSITNQDKLRILTRLKRDIASETRFNRAPVTLEPIDSAKDAALKKMGNEVNQMRSSLPGGRQLVAADKGWEAINDIYDTVQRDLSDPGKAKDTLMKLLRGDTTWLTSGRMAGKVDAIRGVERITGQKVLEPALEELSRQVFAPWMGKGFVSQFVRGAQATGSVALGVAGHPLAAAGIFGSMAAGSPKVISAGIRGARTASQIATEALPVGMAAALDRLATARRRSQ